MTRDDRLRIAVFIDFDNIEIGVKNTLGASFDAGLVLEALRERGDVVSKTAYSDWQRAGNYSRMLTQHAIKMVQRNPTPGGDKNGADINLALDALEMAFTHQHINAFVIVGGDSDFISLVEKLKQYDKKIFVVGGRQFTSIIMQRNCHEFIAYENLVGTTAVPAAGGGRGRTHGRPTVRVERAPIEQVVPLVTRALQVLSEREVAPQMGLLKTTLLQLDSTFSERDYGAGSFRDFVQKLEKIGVVTVQQGKGGLLVGPGDAALTPSESAVEPVLDEGEPRVSADPDATAPAVVVPAPAATTRDWRGGRDSGSGAGAQSSVAPPVAGTNAEGVLEFRRIIATGQVRRWPMYLRNVKQVLRQVNPDFDERAYGFANLVDLLRAAGREGLVRVDRDRQGVIRVFQGTMGAAPTAAPVSFPDASASQSDELPLEFVPAPDAVASSDADEDFGSQPVAAQPHASQHHDEDPDDSIGNRLAPGEVREVVVPRPGVTKRPASSRRPAVAPRKRAAVTPARDSSRHEGGTKRPPRARKARR